VLVIDCPIKLIALLQFIFVLGRVVEMLLACNKLSFWSNGVLVLNPDLTFKKREPVPVFVDLL
jgi:hypothetical protein